MIHKTKIGVTDDGHIQFRCSCKAVGTVFNQDHLPTAIAASNSEAMQHLKDNPKKKEKEKEMKILVVGDVHGNRIWTKQQIERAARNGCDRIVQVGDFSYGFPGYKKFVSFISEVCEANNIDFYWLRGNHDRPSVNFDHDKNEGFVEIAPRIIYITDGYSWEWDGVKFGAVGGAVSIDKMWRKIGVSWWPNEITDPSMATTEPGMGIVDVLFTHDGPTTVLDGLGIPLLTDMNLRLECYQNTRIISDVVDRSQPKMLIHGHYHTPGKYDYKNTICYALACDCMNKSVMILDTEELTKQWKDAKV